MTSSSNPQTLHPGLQWISIKDASALTQKPERTLRHQVAQGKLVGKKQGQSWMIDLNSLAANNAIAILPARGDIVPPPPDPAQQFQKTEKPQPFQAKNSPLRFGLFRELFTLRHSLASNPAALASLPLLDEALRNLAAGYLEFSRPIKIELYRKSRESLAHLWVQLMILLPEHVVEKAMASETDGSENAKEIPPGENAWVMRAVSKILNELLPGLSGTLRKLDQKKDSGS